MNRAKTSRIAALIASFAVTFVLIDSLAQYGHPAAQAPAVVAQLVAAAPR